MKFAKAILTILIVVFLGYVAYNVVLGYSSAAAHHGH